MRRKVAASQATAVDGSPGSVANPAMLGATRPLCAAMLLAVGLRILTFIDTLGPGGAERVMSVLARSLIDAGHGVSIATLSDPSTDFYDLDPRVERMSIGLLGPAGSPVAAAALNVRRARRIRRLLATMRPDVGLSFIDRMNVIVLAANRGVGVPIVVAERTDPRFYPLRPSLRVLRRRLYPRAAAIVVQTQAVADRWAADRFPSAEVHVIPNPVAVPPPSRPTERRPVYVGVGRLTPEKGFDRLIAAFASVATELPDWSLRIHGEGPERDRLREQASTAGVGQRVTFPGITRDIVDVLRECGVFVLSSRFEGFPNVLLEAMGSGTPAISFACPSGPDEIIEDGVSGLLVPKDDVAQLAAAMRRMALDDALRRRVGDGGIAAVSRFRPELVASRWEELLVKVADPRAD